MAFELRHNAHQLPWQFGRGFPETRRRTVLADRMAIVVWGILSLASPAGGQTWVSRPYEVQIWYAIEPVAELLAICDSSFRQNVHQFARASIGRAWSMQSKSISSAEAYLGEQSGAVTFAETFAADRNTAKADKVFVVSIQAARGGYLVKIRELDCQVQRWGAPFAFTVVQPQQLGVRVARGIVGAFRPLAKIGRVRQGQAILEPRAATLATPDSRLLPAPQQVMEPIICKMQSVGDGISKEVSPVPWTALVVVEANRDRLVADLVSGLRTPLRTRSSRDVERYALAFAPAYDATTLLLRARDDASKPLVGYDVYAKPLGGTQTRHVARSDAQGRVRLIRSANMLNTFYVKHGGLLMAKLPLVVGQQPEIQVELADDAMRLTVEGFLKGIEDRLIDAVILRESQLQRVRQAMLQESLGEKDLDDIARLISEAKQGDGRRELNRLLQSRQTEFRSGDRRTQDRIDRMFSEVRAAIGRSFDPAPIELLEDQLTELRAELKRRTAVRSSEAAS